MGAGPLPRLSLTILGKESGRPACLYNRGAAASVLRSRSQQTRIFPLIIDMAQLQDSGKHILFPACLNLFKIIKKREKPSAHVPVHAAGAGRRPTTSLKSTYIFICCSRCPGIAISVYRQVTSLQTCRGLKANLSLIEDRAEVVSSAHVSSHLESVVYFLQPIFCTYTFCLCSGEDVRKTLSCAASCKKLCDSVSAQVKR